MSLFAAISTVRKVFFVQSYQAIMTIYEQIRVKKTPLIMAPPCLYSTSNGGACSDRRDQFDKCLKRQVRLPYSTYYGRNKKFLSAQVPTYADIKALSFHPLVMTRRSTAGRTIPDFPSSFSATLVTTAHQVDRVCHVISIHHKVDNVLGGFESAYAYCYLQSKKYPPWRRVIKIHYDFKK